MLHFAIFSFLGIIILYHNIELKKLKKFIEDAKIKNKIKNMEMAKIIEDAHNVDYK